MDDFNNNFDDFDIGPQSDEFIPDFYENDLEEMGDREAWEDSIHESVQYGDWEPYYDNEDVSDWDERN